MDEQGQPQRAAGPANGPRSLPALDEALTAATASLQIALTRIKLVFRLDDIEIAEVAARACVQRVRTATPGGVRGWPGGPPAHPPTPTPALPAPSYPSSASRSGSSEGQAQGQP